MKALDRKLLRDLRLLWSQGLTIALVVASGIGGFITMLSAVDSLALAREQFYAQGRFGDVFASVKRAPDALAATLLAQPGVADVQTTVEHVVRISMAGQTDPILGRLIGVDWRHPARMNLLSLAAGQPLDSAAQAVSGQGVLPALVSAGFARTRGLRPGDTVSALVNGRQRTLRISGIALSPEYIFAGLGGMPDQRNFGVFWVDHDALAAAWDMQGTFNRVALRLAPGASQPDVIARTGALLAPWGALEAQGRDDHPSHAMLDAEIREQRVLGTVLPTIFLGVAAFLLHVVVSRLVATQREQVAALKALGYANSAIAAHYLKLVLVIVLAGLVLGVALGDRLGAAFLGLYADFFDFPVFEHRIAPWLLVVSVGLTLAIAVAGTLGAIGATVRLAPAEAMRAPAPGHFGRTLLERLGVTRAPPALQMILRNMQRRPWRTSLSVAGVAAAVAIVITGNFIRDAIDHIVDTQFNLAMRSDVTLTLTEPASSAVRHDIARLPGVLVVEAGRDVPVRFINGTLSERTSLQGQDTGAQLQRIIDIQGKAVDLPEDGLVMTDRLARKLGLRVGDTVLAEVLDGRRSTLRLTLSATAAEMMGLNAYMDRGALNRLLRDGDLAQRYTVALERGSEAAFLAASQGLPRVAATFSKASLLRNMQEISARNIRIMSTVMTLFASVIAVGVVYNNARIALAERTWELASLRVLGFTRAEISLLLLGELAICIALALPLGMLGGYVLVHLIVQLLQSDQFQFPVIIQARTYAWAAICVVAAGVASALVVRRRIDRLDMVAALKTRE
ncbi:MAG: ABC transporter permease [Proteobacteria bacterium]|nr:ABC transporter permease [Ramlibacter sp.]MCA0213991.1 ABC transporter permease [Pseudomonadota bacterium]